MDSIRGAYLGLCLGDALGSTFTSGFNFDNYDGQLRNLIIGSRNQCPPGQVTDKSTMTTALLCRICEDKFWNRDRVINEYIQWANNYTHFLSNINKSLFLGIKTKTGFEARWKKLTQDGTIVGSQSNGSLTRCFPLLLLRWYAPQQFKFLSVEDTRLSHPSDVNCEATIVYLTILSSILDRQPAFDTLNRIMKNCQTPEIRSCILQAINGEIRAHQQQPHWVTHSIYFACRAWIFVENQSIENRFEKIIEWILRQKGDTSSNASVVGCILGCFLGEIAIKSEPLTGKNIATLLQSDPNIGYLPYLSRYHPSTGLRLLS